MERRPERCGKANLVHLTHFAFGSLLEFAEFQPVVSWERARVNADGLKVREAKRGWVSSMMVFGRCKLDEG